MTRQAVVLGTVLGMLLVGLVATQALTAELITKTEKITLYDVELTVRAFFSGFRKFQYIVFWRLIRFPHF